MTWLATAQVQAGFGYAAAWFLLLGGVRPVVELQRSRRRAAPASRGRPGAVVWQGRAPESDADQLAGLTGVPGGVWVGLFLVVALAALAIGARLLVPARCTCRGSSKKSKSLYRTVRVLRLAGPRHAKRANRMANRTHRLCDN